MSIDMTRDQFVDKLRDKLDSCYFDEQGGYQVSEDDINAVQDILIQACADALSAIGGTNPHEL